MTTRIKITEVKETYKVKSRIRGSETAADGSHFEEKTLTRYKEVNTVEGWARFGHFMLDRIFFYILTILLGLTAGTVMVLFGATAFLDSPGLDLIINLVNYFVLFPGYYLFFEYFMQSSPAKLILGRIVIDEYGEKPSFKQILARSYSRIVPFEAFSCFAGLGWHDTWSDTMVIRKKDLEELKMVMRLQQFGNDI
jgi:uncharacterized RDD family membrane protein YckC